MIIEEPIKLDFNDVLIKPKRSTLESRQKVDLLRSFSFKDHQYQGIPIVASNMDGVATFEMADALIEQRMFTCLCKSFNSEELIDFFTPTKNELNPVPPRTANVAITIGIQDQDIQKIEEVYSKVGNYLKFVCIDVANGYSERFIGFIRTFKKKFPTIIVIAGNVVTADQTQELILNGADIVKVGIGPGSVCTTRIKTGVGYPQLSAIMECADAAHGLGGYIMADGGCTTPGDIAKAFGGGADFVMLGGMLAGHKQGGSQVENGGVIFYGMSSKEANTKHFGSLKEYRASEGRLVKVPYRGDVKETLLDILGGLRSTCTYVGAKKLKHLSKCTTFIRVNRQVNDPYINIQ